MEGQLINPLAVTHLLQHTLRSLCIHEDSQWVYAVFWRILPRNFPPPKWDLHGSVLDRSRGNRRNWILVWEDGFCNFAASAGNCAGSASGYGDCNNSHNVPGLQPELFFKMSHEIYSYGEGLIGKVAADHSHKWVFQEPQDHEANFLSAWQNPADSHPRTWEAQFQSGIKTIALIAVREGVLQLGAVTKVIEDLSYVLLLRKKFSYLESIPGVLLPHPLSSAAPLKLDGCGAPENWAASHTASAAPPLLPPMELLHLGQLGMFAQSTSSLESLLSKLPSVDPSALSLPPPPPLPPPGHFDTPPMVLPPAVQRNMEVMGWERMIIAKEEAGDHEFGVNGGGMEMAGSSTSGYYVQHARKTDQEGY